MADGLQMGNLSLNESQHAPQGNAPGQGRAAYIPPHLRQRGGPAPGPSAVDGPAPGGDFGGPRYSFQILTRQIHTNPKLILQERSRRWQLGQRKCS